MTASTTSTTTDLTMPALGARVLALTGAVGAALAMCLPWAYEENVVTVGSSTVVARGGVEWTGWGLYGASGLDSHRPVSLAVLLVIAIGTVALLAGAWLAFERRDRVWIPRVTALLAGLLLVASFVLLNHIPGTFGLGHVTTRRYGIDAWRLSLLIALLGAARLAVLFEIRSREARGRS
jgi:hypothetical protein